MADKVAKARKELARRELARRASALPDESQPDPSAPPAEAVDPYQDRARREADVLRDKLPMLKGGFNAGTSGLSSGMMFGFDDEIGGAFTSPFRAIRDGVGLTEAYKREVALNRAMKGKKQDDHPVASMVGEIGGGLAGGGKLAQSGVTIAGKSLPGLGRTGATMAEAGAYGAAYGAGNADGEDMLSSAGTGAAIGAVTGGVLDKAGRAVAGKLAKRGLGPAQTMDDLAAEGHKLYTQATDAGVSLKPQSINKTVANLEMKLKSFGFDKDLQPSTAIVMRKLAGYKDRPISLVELENVRKMASTAAREAATKSDKTAAGKVVSSIDDLIADSTNFSAGSSQALKSLQSAREVWKRKLRLEVLDEINEKALNQATGYENGLVSQLRSLANNKKRLAMFSKDEQALIKSAVRRGGARGALKAFGMLSPTSTFGGIATGGAVVGSGVLPGAALGAAGFGSRKAAEAITRGQFNKITDAAARGVVPSAARLPQKVNPFIGGSVQGSTGLLQR